MLIAEPTNANNTPQVAVLNADENNWYLAIKPIVEGIPATVKVAIIIAIASKRLVYTMPVNIFTDLSSPVAYLSNK